MSCSSRLKVLMAVDFPIYGGTGSPLLVIDVATALRDMGCEVTIVRYAGASGTDTTGELNGIPVHEIARARWPRGFTRLLTQTASEVVYAHGPRSALITAPFRRRRVPGVVELHSTAMPDGWRARQIRRTSAYASAVLDDRVIVLSRAELADLQREGHYGKCLVSVAYPPAGGDPLPRPRAVSSTEPVVLYTGNFHSYQGLPMLLEAMQVVWQRRADARLRIIGGSLEDLRALVGEVDRRVEVIGRIPSFEVAAYQADADLLVIPREDLPINRTTPRKLGEYLRSGRLVVATDVADTRELLGERGAGFVSAPNHMALAEAILLGIGGGGDTLAMARAAQTLASEVFAPEVAVQRRLDVLAEAVTSRQ